MPFHNAKSASIYFEVHGESGAWITLLNGHTRSSRDFKLMAKALVEQGFRCLTLDNRGSGDSKFTGPFTFEDMTDDIISIWKSLDIQRSHILGISMGGMLAQAVTLKCPESTISLCLISTTPRASALTQLESGPWGTELKEIEMRLKDYVTEEFYSKNKILIAAMAKQISEAVKFDEFDQKAKAQRDAIRNIDYSSKLSNIEVPTLIIHGDLDQVIPITAASELKKLINNSEAIFKPGKGHLLLAECSKELTSDVASWVKQHQNHT